MSVRRTTVLLALAALVATMLPGAASAAGNVSNGGFETGDFTDWTAFNSCTLDEENFDGWRVYFGGYQNSDGQLLGPPPEGTYGAITDMNGPGTHILFQDVTLPADQLITLSFDVEYNNSAGEFAPAEDLSDTGCLDSEVQPQQEFRVDVLDPAADPTSTDPADVWGQIYRQSPGDPAVSPNTVETGDLSAFAGQTVRLRFAESQNLFYYSVALDDIQIVSVDPATAPCTVTGTPANETLGGTNGNDVLCGDAGKDTLIAKQGTDVLRGDDGDDSLIS